MNALTNLNSNNLSEMTLTELQEIAVRQQQQIEINQQLLLAKEKRLKMLKAEEAKNQQLSLLTQAGVFTNSAAGMGVSSHFGCLTTSGSVGATMNSLGLHAHSPNSIENANKLENLKQNVLGQELKIFKLKQLRNQILQFKLSNSNMYSELDLIKNLFSDKERELYKAVSKVSELTKQIEQLKKIKSFSSTNNTKTAGYGSNTSPASSNTLNVNQSTTNMNVSELDKLKQELQIRNKLNEQQSKKIIQQHELFNKKQLEVLSLDKRIEELKTRISAKRTRITDNSNHQQLNRLNPTIKFEENTFEASVQNNKPFKVDEQAEMNLGAKSAGQTAGGLNQSPSKLTAAKFATKQEIANTYMNKYGSEAYQKYQQQSMRLIQQQHQQNQQPESHQINNPQVISPASAIQLNNEIQIGLINNQVKKLNIDDNATETSSSSSSSSSSTSSHNNLPSASSSLVSLSPIPGHTSSQPASTVNNQTKQAVNNQNSSSMQTNIQASYMQTKTDTSALPSHLKLEFDKIKYLPDMVKTIKKRHSISEIEGSSNTLPPQIFQKLLERHHKNFLDQQQQLQQQKELRIQQQQQQQQNQSNQQKLNKIVEQVEFSSPQSKQNDKQNEIAASSASNQGVVYLSSFRPNQQNQSETASSSSSYSTATIQNEASSTSQPSDVNITEQIIVQKSTKSIIKQTSKQTINDGSSAQTVEYSQKRRVNFDPHALLLDAAVEGELDLVMRCAKLVKDISEPNDEGITALHNSVCAGHFDIVKFLVEFGCDINYADNDGWTPLHCAASCNNIQMIKFLIENGASIYATTVSDNETAIRKCEEDEEGYQICFEYLDSAMKNLGDQSLNNAIVYALYSYEALNDDELSFNCYDKLVVIDKHEDEEKGDINDGWWTCKLLSNDKEGLVPKNYIGIYPRVQPNQNRNQEESTIC